ncbi:MAG: PD-(D/E)XK nuclease family protein [Muribaculaceae bacterium]|nr:PD-(D/E)XK nuclease family protein [Muribaculaceae bacterium]
MSTELLMSDSSRTNGPAEIVMDYIISYTLRCSKGCNKMPKFEKASRYILLQLLEQSEENQEILSVKTWKQWKRIDLTVEVSLIRNGKEEKHVIVIEDKYYTAPHDNQLIRYREAVDDYYDDKWEKHYVLLTAVYRSDQQFDINYSGVEAEGYKLYCIKELVKDITEPTESDIFNQLWLADWH